MELVELEKAFKNINCPNCNAGSLSPVLRCDLDPKDCVAKGQCNQCNMEFHIRDCDKLSSESEMTAVCEINERKCFIVPAK